jgi:hypothetical protein
MSVPTERSEELRELIKSRSITHAELMHFGWFVLETDSYLQEMEQSERDFLSSLDPETLAEHNESSNPEFDPFPYFAMRTSYSHVIYLASLLEVALEKACTRVSQAAKNIPFELTELKGDKWSTRKKFLERYARFELPAQPWKRLMLIVTLRNFIVHDNGLLLSLSEADRRLFSNEPDIDLGNEFVLIRNEFWRAALESLDQLMSAIDHGVSAAASRALAPHAVSGSRT